MKETFNRAEKNRKMLHFFEELADKYLYDPNSPMRNEEFYIPVLEALIASPALDETAKIRPQARLELAQKNRLGTKALNFTYTLDSGAKGTLLSVPCGIHTAVYQQSGLPCVRGDDRGVKGFSGHQRIHSRQETESPVHLSG